MMETGKMEQLVQQHILEHESRLKHVDELIDRAQGATGSGGDAAEQLEQARRERDALSDRVKSFKLKPPAQWSMEDFERTGPMVVWDTLAQKLEKLVERLEH